MKLERVTDIRVRWAMWPGVGGWVGIGILGWVAGVILGLNLR